MQKHNIREHSPPTSIQVKFDLPSGEKKETTNRKWRSLVPIMHVLKLSLKIAYTYAAWGVRLRGISRPSATSHLWLNFGLLPCGFFSMSRVATVQRGSLRALRWSQVLRLRPAVNPRSVRSDKPLRLTCVHLISGGLRSPLPASF